MPQKLKKKMMPIFEELLAKYQKVEDTEKQKKNWPKKVEDSKLLARQKLQAVSSIIFFNKQEGCKPPTELY
jgi:hypothetical protein